MGNFEAVQELDAQDENGNEVGVSQLLDEGRHETFHGQSGNAAAESFKAVDATLPAIDPNPVKDVKWKFAENEVEIAPGVKFNSWNMGGTVPGPVLAVNEGDEINFTITNDGDMPHSIDFHSARTPPNKNYKSLNPGESHTFTWKAEDPGAFLYHCGTPMALHHMAMGMYGAAIVRPKDLPPADKEFVLVQSEFYTTEPGKKGEAVYTDIDKALEGKADHVVFNGYSNQYLDEPLKVKAGEKVRMWVVNAGPSHESAFHVVGTVFDAVYPDGNPKNKLQGMQTIGIPPGGGAMVEFTIKEPGNYPFVTHAFGDASKGAVGMIEVTK
jgi:nitrite reductase (NO-forming)